MRRNGMNKWLVVGFLTALSVSVDHRRFVCESFSLSPTPVRTLLVDSVVNAWSLRRRNQVRGASRRMGATKGDETWSKTGQGGSRLGVRRRVRSVLNKARKRTGVANDSEETTYQSGGQFISEAASLGLFDQSERVVFRAPDANGASITFPRNDTTPPLVLEEAPLENNGRLKVATDSGRNGSAAANGASASINGSAREESSVESFPNGSVARNGVEVDALLQAAPAEIDPLPFTLPKLSAEQYQQLMSGERVQEQSKMGREGSGFVVMDVPAPAYAVWECLLDFEAYPENIGTVRSMRMFTNTHLKQSYIAEKPVPPGTGMETRHYGMASVSRAAFTLSKFRLKIAAVHKYQPHPDGHYMEFTLDKACTNAVLQDAKGIWYTQENPEGREGYTRIWLLCELKVSPMLPKFIVDYAAKRAMPRATTWLPPTVESFCQKWFGSRKMPR